MDSPGRTNRGVVLRESDVLLLARLALPVAATRPRSRSRSPRRPRPPRSRSHGHDRGDSRDRIRRRRQLSAAGAGAGASPSARLYFEIDSPGRSMGVKAAEDAAGLFSGWTSAAERSLGVITGSPGASTASVRRSQAQSLRSRPRSEPSRGPPGHEARIRAVRADGVRVARAEQESSDVVCGRNFGGNQRC